MTPIILFAGFAAAVAMLGIYIMLVALWCRKFLGTTKSSIVINMAWLLPMAMLRRRRKSTP